MQRGKLGDGREIGDRVKGERRQHGRIRRLGLIIAKRQRIAIRRCLRDCLRPNHRRAARPIIHHKGAAGDRFLQSGGKRARQRIGGAARRIGQHNAHRARRPGLRLRQCRHGEYGRSEQ